MVPVVLTMMQLCLEHEGVRWVLFKVVVCIYVLRRALSMVVSSEEGGRVRWWGYNDND